MRANAAVREVGLQKKCVQQVLQHFARPDAQNRPRFLLHDGPPFANGSLHMGHFLNKILKDIILRYKLMRGYRVEYVPGWDCHGLPIELKALEQAKKGKELCPLHIRQTSRKLALEAIKKQKKDFRRWGVLADWESHTYTTMDPQYEVRQYDILKEMLMQDRIYRGFKPVYWSPSSKTALAESELEYFDHTSQAAYILFPLVEAHSSAFKALLKQFQYEQVACVVWTTTPWTIPSNVALCVDPKLRYSLVKLHEKYLLMAEDLVDSFLDVLDRPLGSQVVATMRGSDLIASKFQQPLGKNVSVMIPGKHVTTDLGTGIVHIAPGHGQEDYIAWMEHQQGTSDILCPVNEDGRFTAEAGPELEGLEVLSEGNTKVLELLENHNQLVKVSPYKHRYPYDWRTKKPVILRATAQWFAKLEELHTIALQCLEKAVKTYPSNSKRRLEVTLRARNEWCISRQRAWGLPIPVFYHQSGQALINSQTIAHFQELVLTYKSEGKEGSDCWWSLPVEQLLPPEYRHAAHEYVRGNDTLDVWFDSGSSWYSVLAAGTPSKEPVCADVYLEGSDQHRGWFQSSLLTSVAVQRQAPYKNLITHGFVLDEQGRKQSKSLGNTVVPSDFIDGRSKQGMPAYGADVIRYWVATTDYTSDVSIGPGIVQKVSEAVRKVRNTARFLLGNLADFHPEKDSIPYASMQSIDKYMLHVLDQVNTSCTAAYDSFAFQRVQQILTNFTASDLSAFYMEACKDRLYCDPAASQRRRSCQTVLHHTLRSLTWSIAPVLCHTAEDIWMHQMAQYQQCDPSDVVESVFTQEETWHAQPPSWTNASLADSWACLRDIRAQVNRVAEKLRHGNDIRNQQECTLELFTEDPRLHTLLNELSEEDPAVLEDVFLCSNVVLTSKAQVDGTWSSVNADGMNLHFRMEPPKAGKCVRCWKFAVHLKDQALCSRCESIIDKLTAGEYKASDLKAATFG
uniref:isoleucine--tRNA ligase n=1 Tax=Albugo laibachii Nc14 TaxID=890382 RepID=F0WUY5_9STRA|nr:isoleucyltRNA synthetase putative [Albugo laibachii Nc14]|eukprot:CCA25221.1 isoleucyltRNA synthetase putative [Albugo laibachii Nc14]